MATLILSAVGTIVAGPLGGMVGAMAGQYIDQNILFKPKPVHGPRLTDLAVQTSSYGTQVPRLYGRMRVAGTVIWALPLQERRKRHRAKGQPDQYTYSYSASFAVAVSSRMIAGVGRIWADGTLIRHAGGRFTLDTGFRIHKGDPDQPLDPLIASAQGISAATAHRDLAYVVFEDFPLADFGNRIPALTFELIADDGPILGRDVLADILPGLFAPDAATDFPLSGYAASGSSRLGAARPIIEASDARIGPTPSLVTLPEGAGAAANGKPWPERQRSGAVTIPTSVAVRHYDPARAWLIGLERAAVVGAPHADAGERLIDCPMALSTTVAAALARAMAQRLVAGRDKLTLPLGPIAFALPVGTRLRLPFSTALWRVEGWRWSDAGAALQLQRDTVPPSWPSDSVLPPPPDTGDLGTLYVGLFDLPSWPDAPHVDRPLLALAQASSKGSAAVEVSAVIAGDTEAVLLLRAPNAAVLGFADTILPAGTSALFDDGASVTVSLVHSDMALANATDAALLAGANIAMLGSELIQYGRADPLPPHADGRPRYRLSHLLRGRGGTEDRMPGHSLGEAFATLDESLDGALPLLPERIGLQALDSTSTISVRRLGTEMPLLVQPDTVGRARMPLSPVHLEMQEEAGGDLMVTWIRRSRTGWDWADGLDAPLDSPSEAYRVTLTPDAGSGKDYDVATPQCVVPSADLAFFRDNAATALTISVRQIGAQALSPPATERIIAL